MYEFFISIAVARVSTVFRRSCLFISNCFFISSNNFAFCIAITTSEERIVKKSELEVIEDEPAVIVDEHYPPGDNANEVDLDSFVSEDMKTDAHP